MHRSFVVVGTLAALLLTLAPAVRAQQGGMAPQGAQAQKGGRKEQHPEIRRALQALERAKYDLEHGAHDFGGHRAQALELVNQVIQQLHQALQSDKK